jgi:hypothetical protein
MSDSLTGAVLSLDEFAGAKMSSMRRQVGLSAVGLVPLMQADDWPAPQVWEVFSHSRNYFVRVSPGTSWGGEGCGFSESKRTGPIGSKPPLHCRTISRL